MVCQLGYKPTAAIITPIGSVQSTWENVVEYDMSERGVRAVTINELQDLGFDLSTVMDMQLDCARPTRRGDPTMPILSHLVYSHDL